MILLFVFLGWVFYLHTTKSWRGSCVFWLFVTMMRGRRDDDVRLRRLFVGKRCKRGVRRSTESLCNDFVHIAASYLTMGMADSDA